MPQSNFEYQRKVKSIQTNINQACALRPQAQAPPTLIKLLTFVPILIRVWLANLMLVNGAASSACMSWGDESR